MEKLINEENEWDLRISATVKEEPADCTRVGQKVLSLTTFR